MQYIKILLGILVFVIISGIEPFEGLNKLDMTVLGVLIWMSIWWITQAVPIYVTAFLPIAIIPVVTNISAKSLCVGYAHPLIFLILGGSIFGYAFQKSGISTRLALWLINTIGFSKRKVIFSVSLSVAFLSMWMSNSSSVITMLPVILTILYEFEKISNGNDCNNFKNFSKCLLLVLAYSASIGGMATLIGTPPNLVLASQAKVLGGINIDFVDWLKVGIPVSVISLLIMNFIMTRFIFPIKSEQVSEDVKQALVQSYRDLGKMSSREKSILCIFATVIFFWIFKKYEVVQNIIPIAKNFTDTTIVMTGAVSLFLLSSKGKPFLNWQEVSKSVQWGVLVLIGGGIALATALKKTDVVSWLASYLDILGILPVLGVLILVALIITFLTEINSNTATTIIMLPVLWALAVKIGIDPLMLTSVLAFSASSAFMLPTATIPNAVVCRDEYLNINDMMRAGICLNLIIPPVIAIVVYLIW